MSIRFSEDMQKNKRYKFVISGTIIFSIGGINMPSFKAISKDSIRLTKEDIIN